MALETISYTIQIDHDGRKYQVHIPALSVPKCGNCGAISLDEAADEEIDRAFRKEANLLTPEEIRKGRQLLGYNQQEFADALGVAAATVSRWENGAQIQQRFHNDVIRAFFCIPTFQVFMEQIHGVKPRLKECPGDLAVPATNTSTLPHPPATKG